MSTKFDRIGTDPYEYTGTSAAEIGYGDSRLSRSYDEWRDEKTGRRIGVYETKPNDVDSLENTIIMQASHDYRLEPLWLAQMDIIASRTKSRVIGVEMPGTVGLLEAQSEGKWEAYRDTTRLKGATQSFRQAMGALRGDFSSHAEMQFRAIEQTVGLDDSTRIILFGRSMGATEVIDSLDYLREHGKNVSDVVLHEIVNGFPGYKLSSPLYLAKILPSTENDRRQAYFDENTQIGHPMRAFEETSDHAQQLDSARKSLSQQAIWAAVNGIGMAQGKQEKLVRLMQSYGRDNAPRVSIFRGQESLAAHQKDNIGLCFALADVAIDVSLTQVYDKRGEQAIGHSHLDSFGRAVDVVDILNQRLELS